jgi:predicted ATPase
LGVHTVAREAKQASPNEGGSKLPHSKCAALIVRKLACALFRGSLLPRPPNRQLQLASLLDTYRYHRDVFVFPPWAGIYRTDTERDQTFEEAIQVHHRICGWYSHCRYRLIQVPYGSVAERCDYIVAHLARRDDQQ